MINTMINIGASIILGSNIMAALTVIRLREKYPEIAKVMSGLGLAIALLGIAY